MKADAKRQLIELCLLFTVFYLPGFITQPQTVPSELFYDPYFNLLYLLSAIPQALLLLYIMHIAYPGGLSAFGIHRLRLRDILYALPAAAGIYLCLLPVFFARNFVPDTTTLYALESFSPEAPVYLIPLLLISSLAAGYSEELFFRVYLINLLEKWNLSPLSIFLFPSILFALGHFYQGLFNTIGIFLMGVFLVWMYRRTRSLHITALAHALYNFSVLLIPML